MEFPLQTLMQGIADFLLPLTRIAAMASVRMTDGRDVVVFKGFPLLSDSRASRQMWRCVCPQTFVCDGPTLGS